MFPYYVNHGMEFLRVQDQHNMIRSIWQKEDGEECFTQKSLVTNGMRIMVKGVELNVKELLWIRKRVMGV